MMRNCTKVAKTQSNHCLEKSRKTLSCFETFAGKHTHTSAAWLVIRRGFVRPAQGFLLFWGHVIHGEHLIWFLNKTVSPPKIWGWLRRHHESYTGTRHMDGAKSGHWEKFSHVILSIALLAHRAFCDRGKQFCCWKMAADSASNSPLAAILFAQR